MWKPVDSDLWYHSAWNRSYSSNLWENRLVQCNVWIHRLPRENVSTMSPVFVGCSFHSVGILLTFTLWQCNVMTLLNNPGWQLTGYQTLWMICLVILADGYWLYECEKSLYFQRTSRSSNALLCTFTHSIFFWVAEYALLHTLELKFSLAGYIYALLHMHFLDLKQIFDTCRCNIGALLCNFGTKFKRQQICDIHALLRTCGIWHFLDPQICTSVHYLDFKPIFNSGIHTHTLLHTSWTLKFSSYSPECVEEHSGIWKCIPPSTPETL